MWVGLEEKLKGKASVFTLASHCHKTGDFVGISKEVGEKGVHYCNLLTYVCVRDVPPCPYALLPPLWVWLNDKKEKGSYKYVCGLDI